MKKAFVLDIDGVITGEEIGVNTPHPHPAVMAKLKEISASGIPIVLCTAKPTFSHKYEIQQANLNNPHIVDGGAVIMNGANEIIAEHNLDSEMACEIAESLISSGIYVEAYTTDGYFTQASQINDFITPRRELVLRQPTNIVPSLVEFCKTARITKLLTDIFVNESENYTQKFIEPLKGKVNSVLINASTYNDTKVGAITALGVSKKQGLIEVAKILDIPLQNMIAVGDSMSDWGFMQVCGYVGAMGNADKDLKDNVMKRGDKGFICGNVNDNGIIEMLDWYMGLKPMKSEILIK